MPDFYAHQVFGAQVFSALPEPVRRALEPQQPGWLCGLYGPDPLFFYHLPKSSPVSREGHDLHRQAPALVLERYRTEEARATPCALGYAAGFLCHYILDAVCHPIVNRCSGNSSLKHTLLEGAFDRSLVPSGKVGFPARFSPDSPAYAAAALGYDQAGPEEFRQALKRFCQVSALAARMRHLTPDRDHSRQEVAELRKGMEGAVTRCAGLVCQLLDRLETGAPLDFLPTLDFSGRETGLPTPV